MSGGFGANTVECPQRKMQHIVLKKRGLGTPTLSGDCQYFCTVTDNGVGDYTINFKSGVVFTQVPEVFLQSVTAATCLRASVVSISSVRVLTFAMDGTTATEADFDICVMGSLARDLIS